MRSKFHYENTNNYYKENCKRIYNELENSYYTYKDLIVYFLYDFAMTGKTKPLHELKNKNILKIKKIFTKKQLEEDKKFILNINKKLQLKSMIEFFEIRSNGMPIIYELIKKNYVSPAIYIKCYEIALTTLKKDVNLVDSQFKIFEYNMSLITKILKGGI